MREIKIGKKKLPIHFGLRAIKEFAKNSGRAFNDVVTPTDSLDNLDFIIPLAVLGLNEGARRSGSETIYTDDDVWDMVDDDPKLIFVFTETFLESVIPLTDQLGDISKNEQGPTEKSKKK